MTPSTAALAPIPSASDATMTVVTRPLRKSIRTP